MAFPTNPINNQEYITPLGTVYKYNSTDARWNLSSTTLTGATGAQGYTGAQGHTGYYTIRESLNPPGTANNMDTYWDTDEEALFVRITGANAWAQVSAGAQKGMTGMQGIQGATGVIKAEDTSPFKVNGPGWVSFDHYPQVSMGGQGFYYAAAGGMMNGIQFNMFFTGYPGPLAPGYTGALPGYTGYYPTGSIFTCGFIGFEHFPSFQGDRMVFGLFPSKYTGGYLWAEQEKIWYLDVNGFHS